MVDLNFVISHPYQKKLDHEVILKIFDYDSNEFVSLELKKTSWCTFNENIIFLIELRESSKIVSLLSAIGSLRNHDDDNNKDVTNFAYLIVKNNSFARCARAAFIFDIS